MTESNPANYEPLNFLISFWQGNKRTGLCWARGVWD